MVRANRVLDLLDLLRSSDLRTVADISDELGVSRRTILRDLATLRDRGWPILAEPGPGGGVYLDRDRGAAAVHFNLDEIVSLWVAARLSRTGNVLPWSSSARVALDKILSTLPPDRARALRRLGRRVVVGEAASPRVVADLGRPLPELLVAFERAFTQHLCLAIHYEDGRKRRSRRTIEPHGLLVEVPAWYLLARDTAHGGARLFRMDRIRRVRVLSDAPFVPEFQAVYAEAFS
jgi:predicted DNA-binding transcriptional regulator YafY